MTRRWWFQDGGVIVEAGPAQLAEPCPPADPLRILVHDIDRWLAYVELGPRPGDPADRRRRGRK